MALSRADFLKPAERRFRTVQVVQLGDVRIRSLTAGEMRSLRQSFSDRKGDLVKERADKLQQLLVAWCVCDDKGDRLLSDEDALGTAFDSLDGGAIAYLFSECKKHTGFANDGDWEAIQEAAKNSEQTATN